MGRVTIYLQLALARARPAALAGLLRRPALIPSFSSRRALATTAIRTIITMRSTTTFAGQLLGYVRIFRHVAINLLLTCRSQIPVHVLRRLWWQQQDSRATYHTLPDIVHRAGLSPTTPHPRPNHLQSLL